MLRRRGLLLSIVLASATIGSLAGPTLASAQPVSSVGLLLSAMRTFPALSHVATTLLGNNIDLGTDGRLTLLLVGSDKRDNRNIGERLDSVIVATINPNTKQISAVSIPRDTGDMILPDPSDTYRGKVNSLFAHYKKLNGGNRNAALEKFRQAVAKTLAVEIDYIVYTRFNGLDSLVDAAGGVPVNVPKEIRDTKVYDSGSNKPKGALFPAGNTTFLGTSAPKCYATPAPINWNVVIPCRHALIYVRSRHGTVDTLSNSDWKRDARQQQFLYSAVAHVLDNGNGQALTDLASSASSNTTAGYFWTNLPITDPADLLALFDLFNGSTDVPLQTVVFKPNTYAFHVPGTRKYDLKLSVVRALTAQWFAAVP